MEWFSRTVTPRHNRGRVASRDMNEVVTVKTYLRLSFVMGKQDYIASPPLSCATGEGPGRAQAGGSELHESEPTGIRDEVGWVRKIEASRSLNDYRARVRSARGKRNIASSIYYEGCGLWMGRRSGRGRDKRPKHKHKARAPGAERDAVTCVIHRTRTSALSDPVLLSFTATQ
jgi:hypothetical protein